jgi:8-oxo-dGTP pyrophosphatase MutT (NUDIX family)
MNRNNLLKLLELYRPSFSEASSKKQIISFVKENINCFERSLEVGHITSSAWIVNKDNSKALLLHHKKLDKWLQLGGHCDGDDNALRVAIKEAQEESGILDIQAISESIFDLDIHLIPKNPKEKSHYHYDIRFLLKITNDKDFIVNQEANALMWINKDVTKLPNQDESMLRMFNKWLAI